MSLAFLANNVLFVGAAFTVLWGTIYPMVAEVFTGVRLSVGPPFFNTVFVPIGLALIALTGIGPLISWRRMSKGAFLRIVKVPLIAAAVVVVVLGIFGVRSVGALIAFGAVRVHDLRDRRRVRAWQPHLSHSVSGWAGSRV